MGLHAVWQDRRAEGPVSATVHPLPLFTQPLGCLNRNRVVALKHDARPGSVAEVRGPVSLQGLGQADGVGKRLVRRHGRKPVFGRETQGEYLVLPVNRVPVGVGLAVLVAERAVLEALHFHAA